MGILIHSTLNYCNIYWACNLNSAVNMKKLVIVAVSAIVLFLSSCRYSDRIEVVSVKSGWYAGSIFANVRVEFKNNSAFAINGDIKAKCQFIKDGEIISENSIWLHNSNDPDWENGMTKTRIFVSPESLNSLDIFNIFLDEASERPYPLKARIMYEDGSLIWDGDVEMTRLGELTDTEYHTMERYIIKN